MSPRDASIGANGFRFYAFAPSQDPTQQELMIRLGLTEEQRTTTSNLLSVTSTGSLIGTPYQLVQWQIANVVNLAMGTRKVTKIGPRGGVKEVYVKDGNFPGEFVTRMLETRGDEGKLDDLRRWLRETADEPRDIAAVRGSVVHRLIELNLPLRKLDEETIRSRFEEQWTKEKRRNKPAVIQEDINFVTGGMRQFWDFRAHVPFVMIAQEPQVFNLQAGVAGSADSIMWFLGTFDEHGDFTPLATDFLSQPGLEETIAYWQERADRGDITIEDIESIGGTIAIGDWKTGKIGEGGGYTSEVVQITAYITAGFIAADGIINERLTNILNAAIRGLVIHIRPNKWEVGTFPLREDVLVGFLGRVAYARFLAAHKTPAELFDGRISGVAPDTEPSEEVADA